MGRLHYQLILNLRFKGRGTNFFKINFVYVKNEKGLLKGHFGNVFSTIFRGGLHKCV